MPLQTYGKAVECVELAVLIRLENSEVAVSGDGDRDEKVSVKKEMIVVLDSSRMDVFTGAHHPCITAGTD